MKQKAKYKVGQLLIGTSKVYDPFSDESETIEQVKMIKRVEYGTLESLTGRSYGKIRLIKELRGLFHIGLKEAKYILDELWARNNWIKGGNINPEGFHYLILTPDSMGTSYETVWYPEFLVETFENFEEIQDWSIR